MSTDSYATSSASESQEPEIGGEMMVVEGSFKYKSWLWEHFTCVTSGSKREKHPPAKCRTCGKVVNRAGGSTTKMKNHLMRYHPDICSRWVQLPVQHMYYVSYHTC
jgi:hypothetical protein